MASRSEILKFVKNYMTANNKSKEDIWICIYQLLLDYMHGVPRITDSNRLSGSGKWKIRAQLVENEIAKSLSCDPTEVEDHLDILMKKKYPPGTQKMNPLGIAFACVTVHLIETYCNNKFKCLMEAKIGKDVFPNLTGFRRNSVDIVVFKKTKTHAVVSSKWGIRHDRIRDPQEEADTYKKEVPKLKFYVATNEFDNARLLKVIKYPTIDGVFHINRDLVWKVYGGKNDDLSELKDLTELFDLLDK